MLRHPCALLHQARGFEVALVTSYIAPVQEYRSVMESRQARILSEDIWLLTFVCTVKHLLPPFGTLRCV